MDQHPSHAPAHGGHTYQSNPFLATASGLGKALSVNPIASLLIALLPLAIGVLIYLASFLLSIALVDTPVLLAVLGVVAAVAFVIIFSRAYLGAIFIVKHSKENRVTTAGKSMNEEAKPFVGRLVSIMLAYVVLFILTGIVTSLAASILDSAAATAVVGAVLVLYAIYLVVRLSLAPFVLVSENLSSNASLKRSYELSKGHFVELLGVNIAQAILSGNGLLSIVGSVAGLEARYDQIRAYKHAKHAKPPVHWMNWLLVVLGTLFIVGYVGIFVAAAVSTNLNDSLDTKSNGSNLFQTNEEDSYNSGKYCYFTESYDYKCTDSESECRSVDSCSQQLEARENLNNIYENLGDLDSQLQ